MNWGYSKLDAEIASVANGDSSALPQNDNTGCVRKILVFVNLGYSKLDDEIATGETRQADGGFTGWSIDQQTGRLTTTYGLDLGGNSIQNVSAILSASGNWRIGEDGKLVVKELEVEGTAKFKGLTEFQNLTEFKNKTKFGTPENPQGITIYDQNTKQPGCVRLSGGALQVIPGECNP